MTTYNITTVIRTAGGHELLSKMEATGDDFGRGVNVTPKLVADQFDRMIGDLVSQGADLSTLRLTIGGHLVRWAAVDAVSFRVEEV